MGRKPKTPEYRTWAGMKNRCYNTNNKDYAKYGAKGITVCARWFNSFSNFLKDMGEKPSLDYSIDRIKNNKSYSPDNCRWATIFQQNQNRGKPKNNTSGHKGINKVIRGQNRHEYWETRIQMNGVRHSVGTFKNLDEAVKARRKKLKELEKLQ